MQKLDFKKNIDKIGKLRPNPFFKGLPDNVKSLKAYEKIEKELNQIIETDHKHQLIKTYLKCGACQEKFNKRKNRISELGFNDYLQYVEWKKIMNIIKNNKNFKIK